MVPRPQEAVHDIFVREPSHAFHEQKGTDDDSNLPEDVHKKPYLVSNLSLLLHIEVTPLKPD